RRPRSVKLRHSFQSLNDSSTSWSLVANMPIGALQRRRRAGEGTRVSSGDGSMLGGPQAQGLARRGRGWGGAIAGGFAALLAACAGSSDVFSTKPGAPADAAPVGQTESIGTGQIKVGLLLPLSAAGNAGLAGQSMRNAAELALAEFN